MTKRAYLVSLVIILLIVSVYAVWIASEKFGLRYQTTFGEKDLSPDAQAFLAHSSNRAYLLDKGFTVDFHPNMSKTCTGKRLGTFSSTTDRTPVDVVDGTKCLKVFKTK